jgi:hypothetical protein
MDPCPRGMGCTQAAGGGDSLQIMRVTAYRLNKQSRTANKRWSATWVLGEGLTTPHRKKRTCNEILQRCSDFDAYLAMTWATETGHNMGMDLREMGLEGVDCINLAQDRDQWRTLVDAVMNFRVQ